jgi:hypothetical protein
MRPRTLFALAAVAGCAAVCVPAPASAQQRKEPSAAELALARDMLKDAKDEVKSGKCADAISMLKQVAAIKETGEVYLYIGDCQVKEGKLIDALASYEKGEDVARTSKDKDKATQQALVNKVADLRARIPTVSVQLPDDAKGAKVKIDGEEVPAEKLEKPIALPAGDHTIEVTSEGRKTFTKSISLAEKDTAVVAVDFEREPGAVTEPGAQSVPDRPEKKQAPPIPLATWIGGGAAIVLLAGGIIAFVAAGSAAEDGETDCATKPTCDESAIDSVRQLDAAALGMWIGAGVAAGVAVTFYVLSRNQGEAKVDTARLVPVAPPGRASGLGAAEARPARRAPKSTGVLSEAKVEVRPGGVRLVGSF